MNATVTTLPSSDIPPAPVPVEKPIPVAAYADVLRKVGGRKFFLCVMSLVIITTLLVFHYLDMEAFKLLFMATVGTYVAGNVTQKATAKPQKVVKETV